MPAVQRLRPGFPNGRRDAQLKLDSRAVPAGAITSNDAFGAWEAELAKFGFAIIHNKIVVIDPFGDNCSVVTGSHNLGFRASHNNDENMVIIRGHRALAEAYACHVLDIYDHYAWRYWLKQDPQIFGKPLEPDDKWQERYISGSDVKSPEMHFWLAAAGVNAALSPKSGGARATPAGTGGTVPSKKSPAKKRPAKKTPAKKSPAKKPSAKKRHAKKTKPAKHKAPAKKHSRKPPKKRKIAAKRKKHR